MPAEKEGTFVVGTEGLTELFVAHRRKLEALARGIVFDRDEAADVVSDAFVAFLERGPRGADEAGAWLYVVTRNKARNRVRDRIRAERRPRPIFEPVIDTPPIDERVVRLLAAATETLPARDAWALEFRFRHGLGYAEIAAALGVSAATARVLVHRASRRLRGQTVGLLADHHGASVSCRAAMLREAVRGRVRSHDGCSSCSAVAEEVHALAARGAFVLPIPLRDRLLDNPLNRWIATHLPGRVATPSPRVAEAFAALLVSGALVTGGGGTAELPAAPTPPPALSPTPGDANARLAPVVDVSERLSVATDGAAAADVALGVPLSTRNVQTFEDTSGDAETVAADIFEFPRLLGVPLFAPDPLRTAGPASGDVRALHVGTLTDGGGGATGLYFRIGLAGAPDGRASYNVAFRVDDTPCTWSTWIHPDKDYGTRVESADDGRFLGTFHTSLSETCSPRQSDREIAGDGGATFGHVEYGPYADDLAMEFAEGGSRGFDAGYNERRSPYPAVTSGRGVALEIPFAAVPPRLRERIMSATFLREVVVIAGVDLEQDVLPDSGALDYRIERGA